MRLSRFLIMGAIVPVFGIVTFSMFVTSNEELQAACVQRFPDNNIDCECISKELADLDHSSKKFMAGLIAEDVTKMEEAVPLINVAEEVGYHNSYKRRLLQQLSEEISIKCTVGPI